MPQKNPKKAKEKNLNEKPTPEQRQKVKMRKSREKKGPWPYEIEGETKIKEEEQSSPLGGTPIEEEEIFTQESLKEICKVLAATVFAIWTIFDKEIEGLDEKEKNMLAEPMASCAIKHQIQKWIKDELALALALVTVISKRIIGKKKNDKDLDRKKGEGENNPDPQHDTHGGS